MATETSGSTFSPFSYGRRLPCWFWGVLVLVYRKAYLYTEFYRAEDAEYAKGINYPCDSETARRVLAPILGESIPKTLNAENILAALEQQYPENDAQYEARKKRQLNTLVETEDPWISIFLRLPSEHREIRHLLHAFNREEQETLHYQLGEETSSPTAKKWIQKSEMYCQIQRERLATGIARLPRLQKGRSMGALEVCGFYLVFILSVMINIFTEPIAARFGERLEITRNGPPRPRSLWQLAIALFFFPFADLRYLLEVGRQRYLGATGSFIFYAFAAIFPDIYGKTWFVTSSCVVAVVCQLLVQLGDLARNWYKHRKIRRELELNSDTCDEKIAMQLRTVNMRFFTWSNSIRKSRSMSVTVMLYSRNLAVTRDIYAPASTGHVKVVCNSHFWGKVLFAMATVVVWLLTSFGSWGDWYLFTIVTAFHCATFVKLLDLAVSPEQEVTAAFNTFANMIGSSAFSLPIVVCNGIGKFLMSPGHQFQVLGDTRRWIILTAVVAFLTLWTDVVVSGLQSMPKLCRRVCFRASKQISSSVSRNKIGGRA